MWVILYLVKVFLFFGIVSFFLFVSFVGLREFGLVFFLSFRVGVGRGGFDFEV